MPRYVELGNRLIGHGPYMHRNVRFYGFGLDADHDKLQRFLDRLFHEPSAGEMKYRALGSKIYVSFAHIGDVSSDVEPQNGSVSEIDVSIWILAYRGLNPFHLRWIPAWLFVDSAPAMAAGREVFGFPKQLGRFEMPGVTAAATRFVATSFVIPRFGPEARGDWRPVIEIEPKDGAAVDLAALAEPMQDVAEFVDAFGRKFLPDIGVDLRNSLLGMVLPKPGITMAFLKQFPEISDTHEACYQAVVEARATVEAFRSAGRTAQSCRGRILSWDSHPFFAELGVGDAWQDVGRGFVLDYDFRMHLGSRVWP